MKIYYDGNDDGIEETQITNIKDYPTLTQNIDKVGHCTFTVHDRLGALYSTFASLDNIKVKVEDDNSNVLFRGYITKKIFKHNELKVICQGFAVRLEWRSLFHNYCYAEGCVRAAPTVTVTETTTANCTVDADDTTNWLSTKANHWDAINAFDADEIYTDAADSSTDETFEIDETITDIVGASVTNVRVYVCGMRHAGTNDIQVNLSIDGWQGAVAKTLPLDPEPDYVFVDFDVSGDPKTQTELQDGLVKITAPNNCDADKGVHIYHVYLVVSYTHYNHSCIDLYNIEDEADFAWSNDYWISNGSDVALLITDNTTTLSTMRWELTAVPTLTNMTCTAGDKDGADTKLDGNKITLRRDATAWAFSAAIGNDGAGNISTSQKIEKIIVRYRISSTTAGTAKCYIKKDGSWISRPDHFLIDIAGPYNVNTIVLTGTHVELVKYLTEAGGAYTGLQGLKWEHLSGGSNNFFVYIDFLVADVYYYAYDIDPISQPITDNGANWVDCGTFDWNESGVDDGDTDPADGDTFKIGENNKTIIGDVCAAAGVIPAFYTTPSGYSAMWYEGTLCMDIFKSILKQENLHWWEDYSNEFIRIAHEDDFQDSGVDITNSSYFFDWEISDDCNSVSKIHVYGNAAMRVYAYAEDDDNPDSKEEIHFDNRILTNKEAKDMADSLLAERQTKRPQIKIPLQGVNTALTVGDTVDLTMVNPTIAEATYPISKIERERKGYVGTDDIFTTIYLGLGGTTIDEEISNFMNKVEEKTRKLLSDRLTTTPASSTNTYASISWDDILGADAGAIAAVVSDTAYGAAWNGATTAAGSKNAIYDQIELVKTNFNKAMKIGSTNKGWINLIAEGEQNLSNATLRACETSGGVYRNLGADDFYLALTIPLPYTIYDLDGTAKNLFITRTAVDIRDADAAAYVDQIRWYDDDENLILSDATVYNSAQLVTWDHADTQLGGVETKMTLLIRGVVDALRELDVGYIQVEYYYG